MHDRFAVVALGGGTGLPVLPRACGRRAATWSPRSSRSGTTAGRAASSARSSGSRRPTTCATARIALAWRERLAEFFNYRFEGRRRAPRLLGWELHHRGTRRHLPVAFREGVEHAGRFLRITGRVYPAATEPPMLVGHHDDGSVTSGESTVRAGGRSVRRVEIEPPGAAAPARVIEVIQQADVLILAPGSLFTSTIPALLGAGVPDALAAFAGPIVYAANIMTQPGGDGGLHAF
jgi:uncharacterized cofD-like protein